MEREIPEQSPQETVSEFLTEEQLAIRALVDNMDRLMPWIFERVEGIEEI